MAVTGDADLADFGVITENYGHGRSGFRTVTEMHNQAGSAGGACGLALGTIYKRAAAFNSNN